MICLHNSRRNVFILPRGSLTPQDIISFDHNHHHHKFISPDTHGILCSSCKRIPICIQELGQGGIEESKGFLVKMPPDKEEADGKQAESTKLSRQENRKIKKSLIVNNIVKKSHMEKVMSYSTFCCYSIRIY